MQFLGFIKVYAVAKGNKLKDNGEAVHSSFDIKINLFSDCDAIYSGFVSRDCTV